MTSKTTTAADPRQQENAQRASAPADSPDLMPLSCRLTVKGDFSIHEQLVSSTRSSVLSGGEVSAGCFQPHRSNHQSNRNRLKFRKQILFEMVTTNEKWRKLRLRSLRNFSTNSVWTTTNCSIRKMRQVCCCARVFVFDEFIVV